MAFCRLIFRGEELSERRQAMLVDSLIVPQCVYRPGSFSGLMTVYESNYLKFDQLCGHVTPRDDFIVSSSPEDLDLHLAVLRRERYTTTLKLTYLFDDPQPEEPVPDPDLLVRIYHDAALVEAVAAREKHRHRVLAELARSHAGELDRRWTINIMLNKWLDYLLDNGHSFA